jgi:hypothetical protein
VAFTIHQIFKSTESRCSFLVVKNTLNIYPPNCEKYSSNSEPRITGFLNRNRQVGKYSFETNTGVDPKAQLQEGWTPRKEFKNCSKNGGLWGIFRVCFTQFLCGYPVFIKLQVAEY